MQRGGPAGSRVRALGHSNLLLPIAKLLGAKVSIVVLLLKAVVVEDASHVAHISRLVGVLAPVVRVSPWVAGDVAIGCTRVTARVHHLFAVGHSLILYGPQTRSNKLEYPPSLAYLIA